MAQHDSTYTLSRHCVVGRFFDFPSRPTLAGCLMWGDLGHVHFRSGHFCAYPLWQIDACMSLASEYIQYMIRMAVSREQLSRSNDVLLVCVRCTSQWGHWSACGVPTQDLLKRSNENALVYCQRSLCRSWASQCKQITLKAKQSLPILALTSLQLQIKLRSTVE